MSRIGKKMILLPDGVECIFNNSEVTVKGPKGTISRAFPEYVHVQVETQENGSSMITVSVDDPFVNGAMWGTARAHVQNMVIGVTQLWQKALELNGVGFRMNVQGKKIVMALGFSHEVTYALPEGIEATMEGNVLTIKGINRDIVGKVASEIRSLKKPEPYKGKGFRYTDEIIRRKAGKAAKGE